MDWLNACHIDTPVVSPVGPQRHNGIGLIEPYAVQLFPPLFFDSRMLIL